MEKCTIFAKSKALNLENDLLLVYSFTFRVTISEEFIINRKAREIMYLVASVKVKAQGLRSWVKVKGQGQISGAQGSILTLMLGPKKIRTFRIWGLFLPQTPFCHKK